MPIFEGLGVFSPLETYTVQKSVLLSWDVFVSFYPLLIRFSFRNRNCEMCCGINRSLLNRLSRKSKGSELCKFLEPSNMSFRKRHTSQIRMAFALQVSYFFSLCNNGNGKFVMAVSTGSRLWKVALWAYPPVWYQNQKSPPESSAWVGTASKLVSREPTWHYQNNLIAVAVCRTWKNVELNTHTWGKQAA